MIGAPMLVSVLSGLTVVVAAAVMVYLVAHRKPAKAHVSFHRSFAWTLASVKPFSSGSCAAASPMVMITRFTGAGRQPPSAGSLIHSMMPE